MRRRYAIAVARLMLWSAALAACAGCSILVQNRYSVFGFDSLQTASAQRARFWSLGLLASVAVSAAGLGAFAVWLVQRRRRRGNLTEPSPAGMPTTVAREAETRRETAIFALSCSGDSGFAPVNTERAAAD